MLMSIPFRDFEDFENTSDHHGSLNKDRFLAVTPVNKIIFLLVILLEKDCSFLKIDLVFDLWSPRNPIAFNILYII